MLVSQDVELVPRVFLESTHCEGCFSSFSEIHTGEENGFLSALSGLGLRREDSFQSPPVILAQRGCGSQH